jgi:deoxyribodipyrimidine photo-lyase
LRTTAVVWFRRDLRLDDNRALAAGLEAADQVVPLFVRDPAILGSGRVGRLRGERLDAALVALDRELRDRGGRLVVRTGPPEEIVPAIVREVGARQVHAQRDLTPYARQRDGRVEVALAPGASFHAHPGTVLVEPEVVGRWRIFTPFHRAWARSLDASPPLAAPRRVRVPEMVGSEPLAGGVAPVAGLPAAGTPVAAVPGGEADAMRRLTAFAARAGRYAGERDRLDVDATSRLSTDLHFGTISARRVLDVISEPGFVRQLAWRDWSAHLAWWDPASVAAGRDPATEPRPDRAAIPWDEDPALFAAWTEGRTGYPAVDAAMRQLAEEGWISNRARMIAASFLVKDLLLDWQLGRAWFERTLVDADVASNGFNWRWIAGVGADAAPFFRVMNPLIQGERFDPNGEWVRRWVPDLRGLLGARVHRPWEAPTGYPPRVVDHAARRLEALHRYRVAREVSRRQP